MDTILTSRISTVSPRQDIEQLWDNENRSHAYDGSQEKSSKIYFRRRIRWYAVTLIRIDYINLIQLHYYMSLLINWLQLLSKITRWSNIEWSNTLKKIFLNFVEDG